jgi:hypothetical protein
MNKEIRVLAKLRKAKDFNKQRNKSNKIKKKCGRANEYKARAKKQEKKSQTCKNNIIVPRGQSLKGRVLSPTRTSEQVSNKI